MPPGPKISANPQAKTGPSMRIATWNVNSIKQRLDHLVTWLRETQPDIVCLSTRPSSLEHNPFHRTTATIRGAPETIPQTAHSDRHRCLQHARHPRQIVQNMADSERMHIWKS